MKRRMPIGVITLVVSLLVVGGSSFCLAEDVELVLFEDFSLRAPNPDFWNVSETGIFTYEDNELGGKWIHMVGDGVTVLIETKDEFPSNYILEYDFMQPSDAMGSYGTVVFHPNPTAGHSYYWLEFGEQNMFGVYIKSDGYWQNLWCSTPMYFADRIYKVRIENEPERVRIILMADDGFELDDSGWLPHDPGDASRIAFSAMGSGAARGAKYGNIRIYVPTE